MKRPALLSLILFSSLGFAQTPQVIHLANVRIEIGDGRVIAKGSILIQDQRILAVGEQLTAPTGAKVVDGKGATVYPGFIDGYTTSGLKVPEAKPAGTGPDIRSAAPPTMWHENRRGIRPDASAAKLLDLTAPFTEKYKQGLLTLVMSPGGATLSGSAAVVNLTEKPTVLAENVGSDIAFRGAPGQNYPGTIFGVTALLRQVLADAQNPPKDTKDPIYAALQPVLKQEVPAIIRASSSREILRAQRLADEFGLKPIIYGGSEGWRILDFLKSRKLPVVLTLDVPDAPDMKPQTGPTAVPQAVLEDRLAIWKERVSNGRQLSEAGIVLAFSSGGGLEGYLTSVRKMIKNGMPRSAALVAMTGGPAAIYGFSKDLGSIETGKLANLVLMSGDFADEKSEVLSVFVAGNQVSVKEGGK